MASSRKKRQLTATEHVKRPTAPYLLYTNEQIGRIKTSDPSYKVDKKSRQQFKFDYDALSKEEKAPYVAIFEEESKAYRMANPPAKRIKRSMQTRMQLSKLLEIIGQFTEEQRAAVKEIGFGGILELKCKKLNTSLCEFLVRSYNTDLSRLDVHGHTLPFSPRDVEDILGLRNEGVDVSFAQPSSEPFFMEGVKNGRIGLKVLSGKLLGMGGHDRVFKITFALYVLGAFLCPTTENAVSIKYVDALEPNKISSFNWAKYVFQFLEKGLKKLKDNKNKSPSGCLIVLNVKYLDRLGILPPNKNMLPRIGFWTDEEISKRLAYVKNVGGFENGKIEMVDHDNEQQTTLVKAIVREVEAMVARDHDNEHNEQQTTLAKAIAREVKAVLAPEIIGTIEKLLLQHQCSEKEEKTEGEDSEGSDVFLVSIT